MKQIFKKLLNYSAELIDGTIQNHPIYSQLQNETMSIVPNGTSNTKFAFGLFTNGFTGTKYQYRINEVGVHEVYNTTEAAPAVVADGFKMYAADIVAGNSAPHWKTENGDVLSLYKNTALTASDGTLPTAVTRIGEIETILQNLGIL